MDDQRVGRIVRALRHKKNWRQLDLAAAADCGQSEISLIERGHLDRVALRLLRRVLAAVDATCVIEVRWRGAALERLLDEGHASIVAAVAARLRRLGWLVEVEVTYSEYGERGSFDILAFHPTAGVLLVVEVKTDLPSAEGLLRKLDEKVRLATKVAGERFGWPAKSVSRLVVMPASMTLRRRVTRHAPLFDRVLPARSVTVRRWLANPVGRLAGVWFLSVRDGGAAISRTAPLERVRRPKVADISAGAAR
jgi:transcriptional regulator with XRE-family HTH domain